MNFKYNLIREVVGQYSAHRSEVLSAEKAADCFVTWKKYR